MLPPNQTTTKIVLTGFPFDSVVIAIESIGKKKKIQWRKSEAILS